MRREKKTRNERAFMEKEQNKRNTEGERKFQSLKELRNEEKNYETGLLFVSKVGRATSN